METDADEDREAAPELPAITAGQIFEGVATSVTGHFTSPPKPYTEDTLLSAMDRAGTEDMPDDTKKGKRRVQRSGMQFAPTQGRNA